MSTFIEKLLEKLISQGKKFQDELMCLYTKG